MKEMTLSERIMASAHRKPADSFPFFHYWRHSQIGWAERECRNRGMGMNWVRPPYTMTLHGVDITDTQRVVSGKTIYRRTYSTPVGSIYSDEIRDAGTGLWHAVRSWKDIAPWQTERLVKVPDDYKVLKYIVENTEYSPDYFPIEQAMDWLGEDGVVLDHLPHSPMQMLMIDWVGSEGGRFFYHHADHPDLVEEVYDAIAKSREPLIEIAAKSPAPITLCGDNVDGVLVTPSLFEKYFMPVYEHQAKVLHENGKLMAVHMDGRLNVLKHLIASTAIDIVEGFHPPPMGDLSISEALSLWPDKAIWLGFPSAAYDLGPEAIRKHAINLLREAGAGDRLALAMSTENLVSNEDLLTLTSVLERADFPMTSKKVNEIERAS